MDNSQAPRSYPLGQVNTYHASEKPHGVSMSLPTWDSVVAMARKEKWVLDSIEWAYPRFTINQPVRELSDAVLRRLNVAHNTTKCMIYCSKTAAEECATIIRETSGNQSAAEVGEFVMPPASDLGDGTAHWASFTAVLFPEDQWKEAMAFWRDTGTGISTRNALFCLEELGYLESRSPNPSFQTPASQERISDQVSQCLASVRSATASISALKSFLGQIATSEQQGQPAVTPDDVFLYPNGTNAIYHLSQTLASPSSECTVVSFGWLYPETVKVLRRCAWKECIPYKNGSEEELDRLETMLSSGQHITALFCELPSNIKLTSPNLGRIRSLADQYGFIVACDDTVASPVNVDVLPYVDVIISSLTKSFSGASNVTGGSLVINPTSGYHDLLHAKLSDKYESTFFPVDVEVLRQNCKDVVSRVQQCSENTLPLVDILKNHPSIAQVNHPSIAPTAPLYKSVMRKGGSYGNVLSIIFHDPRSAKHFYNVLDVCKGTSFGTNFTVAIPYVQLANYWDQEKVPKYGVPQHIIRMSVGLEDKEQLIKTVTAALEKVEKLEAQNNGLAPAKGLLPNDPMFATLVNYATSSNQVVIRDPLQNIEVDYVQFLRDIIRFRLELSSILPSDILDDNGIIKDDGVYIVLSAPSNYQFLVALFAILAVGGAAVLVPPNLSPEELTTLAHKCNALAVAFTPEHETAIEDFRAHAKETRGMEVLPIRMVLGSKNSSGDEVDTLDISTAIENSIHFSTERPALVQFTSGSTGSSKCVMHARKMFHNMVEVYFGCSMSEANGLQHMLGPNAVYLSYRAFHWAGGIRHAMAAILAGVCVEIFNYDGTPRCFWDRLRKGDVKFIIGWASLWASMKQLYEEELSLLPQAEAEKYLDGVRALRLAKSDANLLMPVVKKFWADLGVYIGIIYAATETCTSVGKSCLPDENSDEKSIGAPLKGVTIKLSEGDHGEIRLKSPLLFSCYIGEPEATSAAFDEEGYYKTGDLAHFDGKHYVIDGSVSQDFIILKKTCVSTLDVESSLLALPYITEAHVFGVPDATTINRIAALVRVKEGTTPPLTLATLRAELAGTLAGTLADYQIPTVLRKLDAGTEIPKTHSGKPDVKKAFGVFFPQAVEGDIRTLPSEVEVQESAPFA